MNMSHAPLRTFSWWDFGVRRGLLAIISLLVFRAREASQSPVAGFGIF